MHNNTNNSDRMNTVAYKIGQAIQSFWPHSEGPFYMTLHVNVSLWGKNSPSHRKH